MTLAAARARLHSAGRPVDAERRRRNRALFATFLDGEGGESAHRVPYGVKEAGDLKRGRTRDGRMRG